MICAVGCSFAEKENEVFSLWAGIHAVLAVFNLLPFSASDGGRALRAAMCAYFGVETGERVSTVTGAVCSIGVCILSFWIMLRTGGNGFLLLGAVGLMLPMRKRYL